MHWVELAHIESTVGDYSVQQEVMQSHTCAHHMQHSTVVLTTCSTAQLCSPHAAQHSCAHHMQHSTIVLTTCSTAHLCSPHAAQHTCAQPMQHSTIVLSPCSPLAVDWTLHYIHRHKCAHTYTHAHTHTCTHTHTRTHAHHKHTSSVLQ